MNRKVSPILAAIFTVAVAACGSNGSSGGSGGAGGGGGGGGGGGSGGAGGGGAGVTCNGTSLTATEASNFKFESTITLPVIKVKPNTALDFDWSEATTDLLGHSVDPKKDLNSIIIIEWTLNINDLQKSLNADELKSNDMTGKVPMSLTTDGNTTSANLLKFTLNGSPIGVDGGIVSVDQVMMFFDPAKNDPATHTFTLMASKGTVLGQGTKALQAFQLDSSSNNTKVALTKDSIKLDYKADLHSLTPMGIPTGNANITLNWGKVGKTSMGQDFITSDITHAILANYSESPTELESKFLDLELIAKKLYEADIETADPKVDFSTLKDKSGNKFSGIDGDGTWLLALQCGGCRNPAPLYLTIFKPCN
jgi:hypothetical protein